MTIKAPPNLLYANTRTRRWTTSPLARTRKVRTRVPSDVRKIGVFDISARAGLLMDLLAIVSQSQPRFTFYPIEAPVPMGLGSIPPARIDALALANPDCDVQDLSLNIQVDDFDVLLEQTRERVAVDMIAGLFAPMLAFRDEDDHLIWNYFSGPIGKNIAISAYGVRDYATQAGRPFEAAIALMTLSQVWGRLYGVGYHGESLGCVYDFCENRDDLVRVIRTADICEASLADIPEDERDNVQKCLAAIRNYTR